MSLQLQMWKENKMQTREFKGQTLKGPRESLVSMKSYLLRDEIAAMSNLFEIEVLRFRLSFFIQFSNLQIRIQF